MITSVLQVRKWFCKPDPPHDELYDFIRNVRPETLWVREIVGCTHHSDGVRVLGFPHRMGVDYQTYRPLGNGIYIVNVAPREEEFPRMNASEYTVIKFSREGTRFEWHPADSQLIAYAPPLFTIPAEVATQCGAITDLTLLDEHRNVLPLTWPI